ncbi:hypothetical protein DWW96_03055 [Eubacterium sp. AF17-7]|jgi:hypothetical protein|uniref:hypothetical protein n=1 Tax=Eubacterium sp. AF17-7 TaxID=2293105 RepID=UPI000E4AAC0F|nr:hypothetical protein [Eubacterium sp. AF17-7]RGG67648.1 hypothetical protein DWW96_03055 [Eubacterium sp. AF17-7]
MSNYALENKTENLISIINPGLNGKSGIEVALLYRILPCKEIDSSELVKDAYIIQYGEDIPKDEFGEIHADTIFNAFIPFRDFCVAKLIILARKDKCYQPLKNRTYRKDLNELIYLYLDDIFRGYEDLRELFDKYFDLMYSFSNFMPVPRYFNGSEWKRGKGDWKLNKDYPSLFLDNLNDETSSVYNREKNKVWLETNMEKYNIKEMYALNPPYSIGEYYSDEKLLNLKEFVQEAVRIIEERFKEQQSRLCKF